MEWDVTTERRFTADAPAAKRSDLAERRCGDELDEAGPSMRAASH